MVPLPTDPTQDQLMKQDETKKKKKKENHSKISNKLRNSEYFPEGRSRADRPKQRLTQLKKSVQGHRVTNS
jgi:hypothetical protein